MYKLLLVLILTLIFSNTGDAFSKSQYKNIFDINKGDTAAEVIKKWGQPGGTNIQKGPMGESEVWIYECVARADCDYGDCPFVAPCYYVYFLDGKVKAKYDNTDQF